MTTAVMVDHHRDIIISIRITVMRASHSIFLDAAGERDGGDSSPAIRVCFALGGSFGLPLFEIAPEDEESFFHGFQVFFIFA